MIPGSVLRRHSPAFVIIAHTVREVFVPEVNVDLRKWPNYLCDYEEGVTESARNSDGILYFSAWVLFGLLLISLSVTTQTA